MYELKFRLSDPLAESGKIIEIYFSSSMSWNDITLTWNMELVGTCIMLHFGKLICLFQVVEDEVGSPVDMAKLYMRTRPLWASPTFKNGEFNSLSPAGAHLFREETPYSFGGNSLSSSKVVYQTASFHFIDFSFIPPPLLCIN